MNSLVGFGSIAAFIISSVRFYVGFECYNKLQVSEISVLFFIFYVLLIRTSSVL